LLLASSISVAMSDVSSVICISNASFSISLIWVPSISPNRNAIALMAFTTGFATPAIADTWCRQVAMEACVGGSPAGHNSKCFSRKSLPSFASFMSCWGSGVEELPSLGAALVLGFSMGGFALLVFVAGILYVGYV
jgi:hypothetical protein